jgi:hemerythrin
MIIWDKSLSTGIPNIDEQHQELISNFNKLKNSIQDGKWREETGELLDFLQFYAKWHFEREEELMDKYNCPVAEANKQGHQFFIDRFGQLYEQYQESDTNIEVMMNTFEELSSWIVQHIVNIDAKLHDCVPDDNPL